MVDLTEEGESSQWESSQSSQLVEPLSSQNPLSPSQERKEVKVTEIEWEENSEMKERESQMSEQCQPDEGEDTEEEVLPPKWEVLDMSYSLKEEDLKTMEKVIPKKMNIPKDEWLTLPLARDVTGCPEEQLQIVTLVDTREVNRFLDGPEGRQFFVKALGNQFVQSLTRGAQPVLAESRKLSLGDFCFVARTPNGEEHVLPVIIERKRDRDFIDSKEDGRLVEQNSRLQKSTFHVLYILEGSVTAQAAQLSVPLIPIEEDINHLLWMEGFHLHHTKSPHHTVEVLVSLVQFFQSALDRRELTLSGLTFSNFSTLFSKSTLSILNVFMYQLLRLPGAQVADVEKIVSKYPTPLLLRRALRQLSPESALIQLCKENQISLPFAQSLLSVYTSLPVTFPHQKLEKIQ